MKKRHRANGGGRRARECRCFVEVESGEESSWGEEEGEEERRY